MSATPPTDPKGTAKQQLTSAAAWSALACVFALGLLYYSSTVEAEKRGFYYVVAAIGAVVAAVKSAAPAIHVHAFSPLEIWHGAQTLNLPLRDYLAELKAAGLSSLPGTAAEILDDDVRVGTADRIQSDRCRRRLLLQ